MPGGISPLRAAPIFSQIDPICAYFCGFRG
jgi:hypothetical protein